MIAVLVAMSIYAFVHSWLAGEAKTLFRARFGDRAYYGFYRLLYNAFAVISFLPVLYLVTFHPGSTLWQVEAPLVWALYLVQVIGLIGFAASLLQIDMLRFAGVRQGLAYLRGDPLPLPEERLQMRGLYAVVRHPLYFFGLMILWAVPSMSAAYFGFCVSSTGYLLVGSLLEERRMVAHFGAHYVEYRQRTPWLIPFVKRARESGDET